MQYLCNLLRVSPVTPFIHNPSSYLHFIYIQTCIPTYMLAIPPSPIPHFPSTNPNVPPKPSATRQHPPQSPLPDLSTNSLQPFIRYSFPFPSIFLTSYPGSACCFSATRCRAPHQQAYPRHHQAVKYTSVVRKLYMKLVARFPSDRALMVACQVACQDGLGVQACRGGQNHG